VCVCVCVCVFVCVCVCVCVCLYLCVVKTQLYLYLFMIEYLNNYASENLPRLYFVRVRGGGGVLRTEHIATPPLQEKKNIKN
jgi:hypothetical protein